MREKLQVSSLIGVYGAAVPREDRIDESARASERVRRTSEIRELVPQSLPPRSSPDRALHPLDEGLLERLETRFFRHAGADGRIDAKELAEALGLRSEELAKRVLSAFDRDADGAIDVDDFLGSVRRLLFGSTRDRLLFAFRIHDSDRDGKLSRRELETMIALGVAEQELVLTSSDARPERLAASILRHADRSSDGSLSFSEFESVIDRHPAILRHITTSGACWLAPNEDLLERLDSAPALGFRLKRYVQNRATSLILLALWLGLNFFLFELARAKYAASGHHPLVQIARGCGACLNLNGALILLPMMRRALTALQRTPLVGLLRIEEMVGFHRLVGSAMFGFAAVHALAHLGNYYVVDPSRVFDQLATRAGVTGVTWFAVFTAMWVGSRDAVLRGGRFQLFYVTHSLYVLWFLVGVLHGPVFIWWVGLPLLAFAVEQIVRRVGRARETQVLESRVLRSGVTRLTLEKPEGFAASAGDFVFVRLPTIAEHEWHPFTISSAPERPHLTLHVRALGDWTKALRSWAEKRCSGDSQRPVPAFLDGPYGAPCAEILKSRRAVLIAGGIGVTPFASVLESIVLKARQNETSLERVDFYWLNRDQYSFEWFTELLGKLTLLDESGLVRVHVYMTGARSDASCAALNLAAALAHAEGLPDLVTGQRFQTHAGHPVWANELERIAADAGGDPVEVYFCGPDGLGKVLARECRARGLRFRREQF